MARMNVAAFLDCVGEDEELQQALVEIAADRGYEFTAEELVDAQPGVTAKPRSWQNIAQFPDVAALESNMERDANRRISVPEWVNTTTILAATNAILCGVLAWYLVRDRKRMP